MKLIGLTGGIGTGKSTVSSYLNEKGIPIVDADKVAHEITEIGSPALDKIRQLLGDEVFLCDGNMDRKKVASIIFNDREILEKYQNITTREIIDRCLKMIEELRASGKYETAVFDVPLLFESGLDKYTDVDWVVDADMEVRIARVMVRDNASREEILDRINHQMSAEEKRARADYVLDNSGSLESLYEQIDRYLEELK